MQLQLQRGQKLDRLQVNDCLQMLKEKEVKQIKIYNPGINQSQLMTSTDDIMQKRLKKRN